MSGVSDNALYPILFLDCLVQLFSDSEHPSILSEDGGHPNLRWLVIVTITFGLTYFNYRGLDIVGSVAIVICLVSMFPFLVFCVVGAFKVQPARWLMTPTGGLRGVNWRLLLNTFFWNINYWVSGSAFVQPCDLAQESAANFSGEVRDPGKNYPRGMGIAVVLVFLSLFLPVLVGTGASAAPYTEWTDGYFVQLAKEIGGNWLGVWFIFASALTNIGMFEAEMSSDSWQVAGMADRGILPSELGRRSTSYDTPVYGILMSATGILVLGWLSFSEVVEMLNMLFCFGQAIEFFAFLHLRRVKPDMPRPYRIGVGFYGMCVMLSFPLAFILVIIYFSSALSIMVSIVVGLLGCVAYYLLQYAKDHNLCHFHDRFADADPAN